MIITIFLGTLIGCMLIGMPIAFALLLAGVALMGYMQMFDAQIIAQNIVNGADSFPLLAVPFFILAGEIMNVGGLSRRIVNLAMALVGHIKGGLGYVTILTAILLSALSGSAVADAAALASLLVPLMVVAGHEKSRAAGLVAASAVIGPIIPPSIAFVIFGVAANVSITKLMLAGIFPGLYIAAALWLTWAYLVRQEKIASPPRKSRAEVWQATVDASWALVLPLIIIFGLKFGFFTPTEAGVVAAVYALFVCAVIYRELKWSQIYTIFVQASMITAVVMFLVASTLVSAWLITVAEIPAQLVSLLQPFMDNKILLMLAMMALVVLIGTALDMTPTILILTPVLMPIVLAAGIDPVYFGVLFIINNSIGLLTPPVGTLLNVVAGVSKISMEDVTRGVWPFLIAELIVLFLLIIFPPLVTVPAAWFSR